MSFTHARAKNDFDISAAVACYSFSGTFMLARWRSGARQRTSVALGVGSILRSTMNHVVNFVRFNLHDAQKRRFKSGGGFVTYLQRCRATFAEPVTGWT